VENLIKFLKNYTQKNLKKKICIFKGNVHNNIFKVTGFQRLVTFHRKNIRIYRVFLKKRGNGSLKPRNIVLRIIWTFPRKSSKPWSSKIKFKVVNIEKHSKFQKKFTSQNQKLSKFKINWRPVSQLLKLKLKIRLNWHFKTSNPFFKCQIIINLNLNFLSQKLRNRSQVKYLK
jgi:hypothetical protein